MQQFLEITTTVAAFVLGWGGTVLVERLAPRWGLVQGPNERSSHTKPTPRGGGVAIAVAVMLSALVLALSGAPGLWLPLGLTLLITLLGFADDLMNLSPALRFPVQGVVFATLVWSMTPLVPLELGAGLFLDGWVLAVVIAVVGLWWLNLYNFMDGIDGIAATHVMLVLLGALLVWMVSDTLAWQHHIFWLALAVIAATAGFLVRNWPPAHIFMGDAGSNSLALIVFFIALATIGTGAIDYPAWLILPSAFVADATVAVTRRTARGERPWRAHRRHAYQQLSRLWGHRTVTLLYCAVTALWAVPLALLSQVYPDWAWSLLALTYLPILVLVIWGQSGAAHETSSP